MRTRLGVLLAIGATLVAGCTRDPVIEKTRLGRLPLRYRTNSIAIAPDGWAYAVVATGPENDQVVSTAGVEPPHPLGLAISFLPKSHRFFYWVSPTREDKKVYRFVANGQVIPTDAVLPGPVAFSADGSRWVVTVLKPTETPGTVGAIELVANGETIGSYDDATAPSISPDGTHVAFLGARGKTVTLFVDGEPRQTFPQPTVPCAVEAAAAARHPDLPSRHAVRYLADGSLLVVTRDADGWGIYRDGTRIASYTLSTQDSTTDECRGASFLAVPSIRAAADSPDVYWWERIAGDAELWRVVRNGRPVDDVICDEPWRRHPPETSPDGRHVLYPCAVVKDRVQGGKEVYVVHDGRRHGPYQEVWGPAFSANGQHTSWAAAGIADKRPWGVYVDGERRADGFEMVWRPRVADDGTSVAWEAKFRPEGRGFLGIDDRVIGSFDEILWGPEFEAEGRVAWVIRRGRSLTRVSAPVALGGKPRRWFDVVAKPAPLPAPRS